MVSPESKVDLSQIEKRLHRDRLDWQYYYLYTGKINHHMDKESRRAIIQVILENLGAEGGELYEDDNASSMAAYTPLFDNSIKVQQEKYNVQVAARSNQVQRRSHSIYWTAFDNGLLEQAGECNGIIGEGKVILRGEAEKYSKMPYSQF